MYIRSFLICALVVILMIIALPWVTGKIEQYGYAMMAFLGATIALAPSAAAQARRWLRS